MKERKIKIQTAVESHTPFHYKNVKNSDISHSE